MRVGDIQTLEILMWEKNVISYLKIYWKWSFSVPLRVQVLAFAWNNLNFRFHNRDVHRTNSKPPSLDDYQNLLKVNTKCSFFEASHVHALFPETWIWVHPYSPAGKSCRSFLRLCYAVKILSSKTSNSCIKLFRGTKKTPKCQNGTPIKRSKYATVLKF